MLTTTIEFITDSYLFTFPIVRRISEKQMFTLPHTDLSFLLRAGDHWWVNWQVGKKSGWLKAEVVKEDPLVPPINGWQFHNGTGWSSDPTMECCRDLSESCKEIVVELHGEAKKKWPRFCEGRYLPVEGMIIRGRPVSAF